MHGAWHERAGLNARPFLLILAAVFALVFIVVSSFLWVLCLSLSLVSETAFHWPNQPPRSAISAMLESRHLRN